MTAAIAGRHPGAHVSDVTLIMADNGNNRRARFALRCDAGSGPAIVFVKGEGDFREVHARNGNMFNEADLYASGVPLAVDHPAAYAVVIDRPGLNYVIVMEDLVSRGADPRDATRPMTVSQAASGLCGLARLHSQCWGLSEATHPALAWVQPWAPTEGFRTAVQQRITDGLHLPAAARAVRRRAGRPAERAHGPRAGRPGSPQGGGEQLRFPCLTCVRAEQPPQPGPHADQ